MTANPPSPWTSHSTDQQQGKADRLWQKFCRLMTRYRRRPALPARAVKPLRARQKLLQTQTLERRMMLAADLTLDGHAGVTEFLLTAEKSGADTVLTLRDRSDNSSLDTYHSSGDGHGGGSCGNGGR